MKNKNTIEKPISIVLDEAKQIIVNAVNSTGLPIALLEPIIKDLYNEVNRQAFIQLEREKAEYERMLMEQKEQNKQNEEPAIE